MSLHEWKDEPLTKGDLFNGLVELASLLNTGPGSLGANIQKVATHLEVSQFCGAIDVAGSCSDEGDDGIHVYGRCNMPAGHGDNWHTEMRGDQLWAQWSGDFGEIDLTQGCVHTIYNYT